MSTDLSRNQVLGLFTGVAAFMETFAWAPMRQAKQVWVPESKETLDRKSKEKQRGKTRIQMELACRVLAVCETGRGVGAKQIEQALIAVKNWKYYFVKAMIGKVNLQLEQSCRDNIRLGVKINKPYKCKHPDQKHLLDKKTAGELADNIFRTIYDAEVRAFQQPGISPYDSREPGPVEFGEQLSSSEYMPRQFAEFPTGPFYLSKEDEHATAMSLQELSEAHSSDDEYVETESGNQLVVDYSARNEAYGDMRRLIMRAANSETREAILRKAEIMAKTEIIAEWQFRALKYFAWQCISYEISQIKKARETEIQNAGSDEWITL